MTRMDSVRAATGSAKESVQHAAEAVAPYAGTAKEQAAQYAHEARVKLAPTMTKAAQQARVQYGAYVAPHVPPKVDDVAHRAAVSTRKAARQAADYTVPRVEQVRAVAQPVAEEAAARSAAALAALRGGITAKQVQKLVRRHERRARAGRLAKGLAVLGLVAGGTFAAWKWWDKQANPDWLVEPPAATEVSERGSLTSVDGSHDAALDPLDPDARAKQGDSGPGKSGPGGSDRDDRP
ncbi:nosiheptide resistance regulatory protein [Streptomyces sp. 150FB]|uniref:DUF5324 family protein n=1 Tax=Streptomyces sp. 150FB TaxID=1576605 RepID=UPI000588EF65|nr:DUF5324 family protein [Streptomyces sp. 150FB]KIF75539.1 nosiheptide resistance regulatory protein [Streptomyces sp. 150FB]